MVVGLLLLSLYGKAQANKPVSTTTAIKVDVRMVNVINDRSFIFFDHLHALCPPCQFF